MTVCAIQSSQAKSLAICESLSHGDVFPYNVRRILNTITLFISKSKVVQSFLVGCVTPDIPKSKGLSSNVNWLQIATEYHSSITDV